RRYRRGSGQDGFDCAEVAGASAKRPTENRRRTPGISGAAYRRRRRRDSAGGGPGRLIAPPPAPGTGPVPSRGSVRDRGTRIPNTEAGFAGLSLSGVRISPANAPDIHNLAPTAMAQPGAELTPRR